MLTTLPFRNRYTFHQISLGGLLILEGSFNSKLDSQLDAQRCVHLVCIQQWHSYVQANSKGKEIFMI